MKKCGESKTNFSYIGGYIGKRRDFFPRTFSIPASISCVRDFSPFLAKNINTRTFLVYTGSARKKKNYIRGIFHDLKFSLLHEFNMNRDTFVTEFHNHPFSFWRNTIFIGEHRFGYFIVEIVFFNLLFYFII